MYLNNLALLILNVLQITLFGIYLQHGLTQSSSSYSLNEAKVFLYGDVFWSLEF